MEKDYTNYVSGMDLKGKKHFGLKPLLLAREQLDYPVKNFLSKLLDNENTYLDKNTGYLISCFLVDGVEVFHKIQVIVHLTYEKHFFDRMFIDGDKIIFMNDLTGHTRRINPSRIISQQLNRVYQYTLKNNEEEAFEK